MKKQIRIIALLMLVLVVISTGLLIVFADQENEMEIPCEHEYQISDFDSNGVATFTCNECEESFTVSFSDHVNERGYDILDLNSDGIVNGKDYGLLLHYRN